MPYAKACATNLDPRGRLIAVCILAAALASFGALAADTAADEAGRLITRAGNSGDDAACRDYLKQLHDLPGLDPELQAQTARLIAELDRWVTSSYLPYFGNAVLKTRDYDFGVPVDSPLYPITDIYRGRMLSWVMLGIGGNIQNKRGWFDDTRAAFERARTAFPENRIVRMYLGEPIPPSKVFPEVAGAPEWAVYQRESLERVAGIITWWIDNRMQENGEYGGGWADDCEMWRFWVPVLIGFDDPRITAAQARFSNALMSQKHMLGGYTSHVYDVEHTAEDSADVITPMMHLEPDNPDWSNRALRLAYLMETLWTGMNDRGFLQFKSTYFSVDSVSDNPQQACDTTYHPRAVQPTLLYWQRTGDERLGRLFTAWMNTWVDAAARAERGKAAGIIPSAIHWPDGTVGGLGEQWWKPENHGESGLYTWPSAMSQMLQSLLLAYHMTQDPKYLDPIKSMARIRLEYLKHPPENAPEEGSEAWCAAKMDFLKGTVAKYRFLTGKTDLDELLALDASTYTAFRMTGNREGLEAALEANAAALRINFEGYTSEVRYTDRVIRFPSLFAANSMYPKAIPGIALPDTDLLYSTATGDPGSVMYFPLNAVRWLTPPRDLAALVTESGTNAFTAELFHFGEKPRPMAAELYLLEPGNYAFSVPPIEASITSAPQPFTVTGARTRITFELPPRRLCVLRVVHQEN